MTRKGITAPHLPAAGPYSHAVESDGQFFLSGQTPVDPDTGKLVSDDIALQTKQCFQNLFDVLKACNLTADDVQKVNVYLTNMDGFAAMNTIYERQFSEPYPARTTVGVASLPKGAKIEIEMIARKK